MDFKIVCYEAILRFFRTFIHTNLYALPWHFVKYLWLWNSTKTNAQAHNMELYNPAYRSMTYPDHDDDDDDDDNNDVDDDDYDLWNVVMVV